MATVESAVDRLAELRAKLRKVQARRGFTNAFTTSGENSPPSDKADNTDLKDATFLELFAGEAGLTAAVNRAGMVTLQCVDVDGVGVELQQFDLLKAGPFKKIKELLKSGKVRWLHMAPPCKTFSCARRSDRFGKVKKLRSRKHPEGFEPKPRVVREGNLLAARSAQLAMLQYKAGGWFSIENPATSFMWIYAPVRRLLKLEGVQLLAGDQCMFGGEYRKPTSWLTNAEHIKKIAVKCPGPPEHEHPALAGKVRDFHGKLVWKTSLAAEYPEGLCDALAKSYKAAINEKPLRPAVKPAAVRDGELQQHQDSKRWQRKQENEQCVGGLRNPHKSMELGDRLVLTCFG